MTLTRTNGQNKAMMSSKGIIRKTRKLIAVAISISSSSHIRASGQPPHFLLPNPTNQIDQTGCFL
jgi:hypothetical protein